MLSTVYGLISKYQVDKVYIDLSSAMEHQNQQVQWRRDKVQELCSKGYSQREISQVLQVGLATVNRDIS
jgi:Trp operon repressor